MSERSIVQVGAAQHELITTSAASLLQGTQLQEVTSGQLALVAMGMLSPEFEERMSRSDTFQRRYIAANILKPYAPRRGGVPGVNADLSARDQREYGKAGTQPGFDLTHRSTLSLVELVEYGSMQLSVSEFVGCGSVYAYRRSFSMEGRALVLRGEAEKGNFSCLYRAKQRQLDLGGEFTPREQQKIAGILCNLLSAVTEKRQVSGVE